MPVPEGQRRTVQVKLRLSPAAAAELRRLATHHGISVSEVVSRMVGVTQHKSPANSRNDSERNEE